MARVRSPNYPVMGLAAAIERARSIHRGEGKNVVAREAIAKLLGYGGINGQSAQILSALTKYGLLEAVGEGEARISDLAMRIMFPGDSEEKRNALEVAAYKPAVFSDIREKWPDRPPSDEGLRSFLIRKGFSEGALDQVIQFYREIIDMAPPKMVVQDSPPTETPEVQMTDQTAGQMQTAAPITAPIIGPKPAVPAIPSGKPFTVAFDGATLTGALSIRSVRDIERLIKVLQAQKAAFEAMQDEEEDEAAAEAVN